MAFKARVTRWASAPIVAERGEIAVRIIRAARDWHPDRASGERGRWRHAGCARHADETVPVGPAHASKSCLN
jgi:acetyl-CoA carboxylase biotin carboxylase subunit